MEVRVGFHQIRRAVYSEIGVHIVHVHAITQRVVWKTTAA
jgi:hypothetical protein